MASSFSEILSTFAGVKIGVLLDLSLNPILVLAHEASDHLIVRTLGTAMVSGLVSRQYRTSDRLDAKTHTVQVSPGVELPKGRTVTLETRLLPVVQGPAYTTVSISAGPDLTALLSEEKSSTPILPDPYEVATAYRSLITGTSGTWRLAIQMQRRPTGTWIITVSQCEGPALVAVAIPKLDLRKEVPKSNYPLTKIIQGAGKPDNAWGRLIEDDD